MLSDKDTCFQHVFCNSRVFPFSLKASDVLDKRFFIQGFPWMVFNNSIFLKVYERSSYPRRFRKRYLAFGMVSNSSQVVGLCSQSPFTDSSDTVLSG